ncbi:MAG TPA: hypothetical protein VI142_02760 [Gaiellaceae bacterium]
MTSHVGRLYSLALALFVFFLTWATVAAHPWSAAATPRADPRAAALAARQLRLRHESIAVARVVRRRWAVYRRQLQRRQQQIAAVNRANAAAARQAQLAATAAAAAPTFSASGAAAPSVSVVTLPPVTITRTS